MVICSFINIAISYSGNRGGQWKDSSVPGVCDILLWHCSNVFIMNIMLWLWASLTDKTQVE